MKISKSIDEAVELLVSNNLVVIPTETVYGLAGNCFSEEAVEAIYHYKSRPKSNPLIVHIHSMHQLTELAKQIPTYILDLLNHFWPGPLTILLEKSELVPDFITSGSNKVAIRIPNHPLTLELLKNLPFPLVAPSANPYQRVSPTKVEHVINYFNDALPMVLDGGDCEIGIESTIIDGTLGNDCLQILREGTISEEQIKARFPKIKIIKQHTSIEKVPGSDKKHYSPTKPLLLFDHDSFRDLNSEKDFKVGLISNSDFEPNCNYVAKIQFNSFNEGAKGLYNALLEMEQNPNVDIIYCERFKDEGIGKALNDKLKRASCQ